ncbi:hypothetical protein M153_9050001203 [Pseudoloma neurophilia]|uniref:Uncharacterized protein n=1 Tax=Pseudoloma neurophilia TaxID=146866 RepID=A0A0R0M1V4_9MICR|nr:hypothetical protein M153_9050001203 [Pseudoloma neurophilia]
MIFSSPFNVFYLFKNMDHPSTPLKVVTRALEDYKYLNMQLSFYFQLSGLSILLKNSSIFLLCVN